MTEQRPTERHAPEKRMSESAHQRAIFKWTQQPHIRQKWPDLKLLFHVKNETTEGARQVAVDRASGVKPGVPDLCLPVARGKYHGMFVELKNETGRLRKEQKWWLNELGIEGYFATVCHGWESAVRTISWYMEGAEGNPPRV